MGGLTSIDDLWGELFPAEQERIVKLLVRQVVVKADGLEVVLRSDGLQSLAGELSKRDEPNEE